MPALSPEAKTFEQANLEDIGPQKDLDYSSDSPTSEHSSSFDSFQRFEQSHGIADNEIIDNSPEIRYQYQLNPDIKDDISSWFGKSEIAQLEQWKRLSSPDQTVEELCHASGLQSTVNLLYKVLGSYGGVSFDEQFLGMEIVAESIIRSYDLCDVLAQRLLKLSTELFENHSKLVAYEYFYLLTIHFVLLTFCVQNSFQNDSQEEPPESLPLKQVAQNTNLLARFVEFLDRWRWHENSEVKKRFRLGNVFQFLDKLVQVQLGDLDELKSVSQSDKTISPIEYHMYQSQLRKRYPAYTESVPIDKLVQMVIESNDNSSSSLILNLENAKPQTPPVMHLATPIPSPKLSPYMDDSMVSTDISLCAKSDSSVNQTYHGKKKLFNTNMEYPNMSSPDLPSGISQAAETYKEHVGKTAYTEQFEDVMHQFIEHEIGVREKYVPPVLKQYANIEAVYSACLPLFGSLAVVSLQVLESNRVRSQKLQATLSTFMRECLEKEGEMTMEPYLDLLEVVKAKEVAMKCVMNVLTMLTGWFKVNHFCQSEYLCSVLYENDFVDLFWGLLDDNLHMCYFSNKQDFPCKSNRLVNCPYDVLHLYKKYSFELACSASTSEARSRETFTDLKDQYKCLNELSKSSLGPSPLVAALNHKKHTITRCNFNLATSITSGFRILGLMLNEQRPQRVYRFLDHKPTDTLRHYLVFKNEAMYSEILPIVKLVAGVNGKKWKSQNMDLVSLVYLYHSLHLDDCWLTSAPFTGQDCIQKRLQRALDQESAFQSLIRFYHYHYYNYTAKSEDFFEKELEKS